MKFEVYVDGSCDNAKRIMGVGIYFKTWKKYISKNVGYGTSNKAEWYALILALATLVESKLSDQDVYIYSDSRCVVNVFNLRWDTKKFYKEEHIAKKLLYELVKNNCKVTVKWISRKFNGHADEFSKYRNNKLDRTFNIEDYVYKFIK